MKKAFLFMLAALCVSAVQAVTLTWSGNTIKTLENVDYTKDITIVYDFTLSGNVSERTKMLELALNGGNMSTAKGTSLERHTIEFRYAPKYEGPNMMHFSTSTAAASTPRVKLDNAMSVGTHQLKLTFNVANKKCQIDFVHGSDSSKNYSGTLTLNNDLQTNDQLIVGTFEAASSTTTVTYTSVPEPTALALLALGVAGLALKRKVA